MVIVNLSLSKSAGDVVFRALITWAREQRIRHIELDQLTHQKEGGPIRHTRGLLHIVCHDHDRQPLTQARLTSSMRAVAIGSSAEQGSSISSTSGSTARLRAIHSRCC